MGNGGRRLSRHRRISNRNQASLLQSVWPGLARYSVDRGDNLSSVPSNNQPFSEVEAAVQAVERDGTLLHAGDLVAGAAQVIRWMSEHRAQLIAVFELVLGAVQQAEVFANLSGAEKKRYASSLVLAVLDDLGFHERTGLLFAIVNSLISASIESGVRLFNKRGVFRNAGSAVA